MDSDEPTFDDILAAVDKWLGALGGEAERRRSLRGDFIQSKLNELRHRASKREREQLDRALSDYADRANAHTYTLEEIMEKAGLGKDISANDALLVGFDTTYRDALSLAWDSAYADWIGKLSVPRPAFLASNIRALSVTPNAKSGRVKSIASGPRKGHVFILDGNAQTQLDFYKTRTELSLDLGVKSQDDAALYRKLRLVRGHAAYMVLNGLARLGMEDFNRDPADKFKTTHPRLCWYSPTRLGRAIGYREAKNGDGTRIPPGGRDRIDRLVTEWTKVAMAGAVLVNGTEEVSVATKSIIQRGREFMSPGRSSKPGRKRYELVEFPETWSRFWDEWSVDSHVLAYSNPLNLPFEEHAETYSYYTLISYIERCKQAYPGQAKEMHLDVALGHLYPGYLRDKGRARLQRCIDHHNDIGVLTSSIDGTGPRAMVRWEMAETYFEMERQSRRVALQARSKAKQLAKSKAKRLARNVE